MTPDALKKLDRELSAFIADMTCDMGRPERRAAMGHYITGLLLDGERKSVQPMATRLVHDPAAADAMRQRLTDCVSTSRWSDAELLRRLALKFERELPGVEAFVIDDTRFPKKGSYRWACIGSIQARWAVPRTVRWRPAFILQGKMVAVALAYDCTCPKRGPRTASAAPQRASRKKSSSRRSGRSRWTCSTRRLRGASRRSPCSRTVATGKTRSSATRLDSGVLRYVVGVPGNHLLWPPGSKPTVPTRTGRPGRPKTQARDGDTSPIQINKLVEGIPRTRYKTVSWRSGSRAKMSSKFLIYRVRPAEKHTKGRPPDEEQWLIGSWAASDKAPTFHFSNLPAGTTTKELIRILKLRWRVERDHQEMKGEVGLDHFEGRTWRGFHHHATLCAVAHGFLALRRALFPPEQSEMDATDGSQASTADRSDEDRLVSPVCTPDQRALTSARFVAFVAPQSGP